MWEDLFQTTKIKQLTLFIKQIQNFDMVLLTETHVGYNTPVNIDCFLHYPFCREKSRFFGGLGVLIRKNIRKSIAILQDGSSQYQWIKLKKEFFNLKFFLCLAYLAPQSSQYINKLDINILKTIEKNRKIFIIQ